MNKEHRLFGWLFYPVLSLYAWLVPKDHQIQDLHAAYRRWLKAPKGPERQAARAAYMDLRDRQPGL